MLDLYQYILDLTEKAQHSVTFLSSEFGITLPPPYTVEPGIRLRTCLVYPAEDPATFATFESTEEYTISEKWDGDELGA